MSGFKQQEEKIGNLASTVTEKLINEFSFVSINIPDDSDEVDAVSSIFVTSNYQSASKALVIIQNAVGSILGIFSRSMCMDQGLDYGSMIPFVREAIKAEYAVFILRPNANSVMVGSEKKYIRGCETPDSHVLFVWENIISPIESLKSIVLLGYGNGAPLCKDLFLRQMVRTKENASDLNRISGIIMLNASHFIEIDDAEDIRAILLKIAVNLECNSAPLGYRLKYRQDKLGCETVSLGAPDSTPGAEINDALAIFLAITPVVEYLKICERTSDVSLKFSQQMAELGNVNFASSIITTNPNISDAELTDNETVSTETTTASNPPKKQGFFSRMFGSKKQDTSNESSQESKSKELTVNDFHLLKVVGKGAFGKVMLVRKKNGTGEGSGQVYAMKVLKKSVVAAKGQIEHTKSEREILCEIRHPYIVRLRFAFQNAEKLYLVTDYYNSGTLFYHLRKNGKFTQTRARFYACELLSALDHLHQQAIIYRDLKLENILMAHTGHIALTDFGLSKQGIDSSGGATTFCGTAEYLAPELLQNLPYGPPVDWWSFGILIYEMLEGKTPFFDKNRKNMFCNIVARSPVFTSNFTPEAIETIKGLLTVNAKSRLGSEENGAKAIMNSPFFAPVNFDQVYNKEVPVPFLPDVSGESDTKYVPKAYLMAQAEDSICEIKPAPGLDANFNEFSYAGENSKK